MKLLFGIAVLLSCFVSQESWGQTTGYYPYVIARGEDRQILRSMPIEQRPSRPLHFYGNTVRWISNRTSSIPWPAPIAAERRPALSLFLNRQPILPRPGQSLR